MNPRKKPVKSWKETVRPTFHRWIWSDLAWKIGVEMNRHFRWRIGGPISVARTKQGKAGRPALLATLSLFSWFSHYFFFVFKDFFFIIIFFWIRFHLPNRETHTHTKTNKQKNVAMAGTAKVNLIQLSILWRSGSNVFVGRFRLSTTALRWGIC